MRLMWRRMVAVWVFVCVCGIGVYAESRVPRYIFFFIGDGMGFGQVEISNLALREQAPNAEMRMTRLPVTGKTRTQSANSGVTDSGAAGTALATGFRTNNGRISQLPDGTPIEPVSLKLQKEGMKIGVLSSVTGNHATPAAFYSNAGNRNEYENIGMQFIESGVAFLAGRGLHGGAAVAERVMNAYREAGIVVINDFAEAASVSLDQRMAVLAESVGIADPVKGDLADILALAITRLKDNPKGFFMMIEGGAIDWAGHENNELRIIDETLAMDRAVEVAYQFYKQYPEDTLIIVTADHETGGLRIHADNLNVAMLRRIRDQRDAFAQAIPDAAEDRTMEGFLAAMQTHFGFGEVSDQQREQLEKALTERKDRLVGRAAGMVRAAAGVTWRNGQHTGWEVPIYAIGAGAERFADVGHIEEFPRRIYELVTGRALAQ
jgi:alkaline phosphatase